MGVLLVLGIICFVSWFWFIYNKDSNIISLFIGVFDGIILIVCALVVIGIQTSKKSEYINYEINKTYVETRGYNNDNLTYEELIKIVDIINETNIKILNTREFRNNFLYNWFWVYGVGDFELLDISKIKNAKPYKVIELKNKEE